MRALCGKHELRMKRILFILVLFGAGWKFYNYSDQVTLGPGVLARDAPQQENGKSFIRHTIDDYNITGLAKFRIKAKVLSKKNYYTGREADISPTDLALGWGNMSDESILDEIKISQSGRFYRWHVESFPIPRREIETHSANMHLIPISDSVKSSIDKARQGDIVEISGDLVEIVSSSDSWRWKSSQTRDDTGSGACELILVEEFQIVTP